MFFLSILQNGHRLPESPHWKIIFQEDHCTLLIYEVRPEDVGTYECVVVNKLGKATCSAKLNVEGDVQPVIMKPAEAGTPPQNHTAPQLVTPLKDQVVDEGSEATFNCQINATPGLYGVKSIVLIYI